MNMKLKLLIWVDKNRGLCMPILNLLPSILAFFNPLKKIRLFEQLSDK
jgi:hypothetical protein